MERYEHKVVLITGAGDIAGATARRLLSEGGKVALTDFSREALDQEARMLKEEGWDEDRVMTIPGDVRSLEDCQAAAAEVKEKWGRIDVLVATAGILRHFPIDELTEAQWQDVIDINLTGVSFGESGGPRHEGAELRPDRTDLLHWGPHGPPGSGGELRCRKGWDQRHGHVPGI